MTYLQFHLVFILPPILMLFYYGWKRKDFFSTKALWSLAIIGFIAFTYTTPWDNLLVKTGVWGYGADRVIGTIGYVPIEEYMFFILQPILTCFFLLYLISSFGPASLKSESTYAGTAHWAGTLLYTYLSLGGMLLLQQGSEYYYLAIILVWASPILAIQWAVGGYYLWKNRRVFLLAVSIPTLYLWIADRIAIELGIWYISTTYTTGLHLFGLPIEEAVFFAITNLLVIQGIMLSMYKWEAFLSFFKRRKLALIGK